MNTTQTSAREQALTNLVACFALDKKADLPRAISAAKEQGIAQDQIDRIGSHVQDLQSGGNTEELSLSEQLAKATKSSCCP